MSGWILAFGTRSAPQGLIGKPNMASKKQRVRLAKGVGDLIKITNDDWDAIEQHYKHVIPARVRARLYLVTFWFAATQPGFGNAPKKGLFLKKIRRLQEAVKDLNDDLLDKGH